MGKESLRLSPILLLGKISWCILDKLDSFLFPAEVKADSLGFLETTQVLGNQMLSFSNGLGFGLCNLFVHQAAGSFLQVPGYEYCMWNTLMLAAIYIPNSVASFTSQQQRSQSSCRAEAGPSS